MILTNTVTDNDLNTLRNEYHEIFAQQKSYWGCPR